MNDSKMNASEEYLADFSKTITISSGGNSQSFPLVDFVGTRVSSTQIMLRDIMNIGENSIAIVDGKQVNGNYEIPENCKNIEFVQPSGTKGEAQS